MWVCKKTKQSSVRVKEIDDKDRPDLIEVKVPEGKIRQASFTRQRLFVLTEKGNVYVFKIKESLKNDDLFDEHLSRP